MLSLRKAIGANRKSDLCVGQCWFHAGATSRYGGGDGGACGRGHMLLARAMCLGVLAASLQGCGPHVSWSENKRIKAVPENNFTNNLGMEMIYLNTGYYVSKYETRQKDFETVMRYNPS